jgi:septal ring factor EnvC (AmiA/AmiB activator)
MNITEVRNIVKLAIAEAMEKSGLPKSGGKLVHLKKELAGLKNMKESLGQLQIAEGGEQQFVAEYAHMQKFVTELEKIKSAHAKLAEMLDKQISEVETKVSSETEKIKEMVGLIEKAPKKAAKKADKKDAPKADKKDAPKAEKEEPKEEKEAPKADDKKKSKKLNEYEHHYEKVNGECRKYNDEGDYTVVSDYYCN